jgi:hypothetical protein
MERTNATGNASAGFEGIAQMLLEQKKLMDALEAENRDLRRQLDDLRRGVGISVVIEGKTIPLAAASSGEQALATVEESSQAETGAGDRREKGSSRSPLADSYVL